MNCFSFSLRTIWSLQINQDLNLGTFTLLAITHDFYKSFDEQVEVREVFLDISKAFDKVWHEGLLLKLNQNGISEILLNFLHDLLSCPKQRVVLNGQHSSWDNVTVGAP